MSESDFTKDQTEASVVYELTKLAEDNVPAVQIDIPDGRKFIISRDDFKLEQITLANAADVLMPKIVTQAIAVQKASSLADYVKRFKNEHTLLFANIEQDTIVGAIDYHNAPNGGADPAARLGAHNVVLKLARSEEWKRWTGQNEKLMSQVAFADFLEENGTDVTDPSGASLLEMCRDLHATSGNSIKTMVRDGDTVKIAYEREDNATSAKGIELPSTFIIDIPVYFGESPIELVCLMRRKNDDGKLSLGFKIVRLESERQREFQRIVDAVSVDTDTLAIYGNK